LRRMTKTAALLSAAALLLSACGGDDGETSTNGNGNGEEPGAQSDIKVGMAYDVGGRGDQSFNDAAARGLDRAVDEFGMASQESEADDGEPESAREERLRTFADAGFDPIIAVGFAYSASVAKVAEEYPDVHFAIIDDEAAQGDNISNLVFAEEQGSFLVGAAAALKSKTDHIGFIGGVEVPLIQKFEAGYVAGAKEVNPNVKVDITYLTQAPDFSGFNDPAKGKTAAQGMFDAGADVVFHAAGGSGGGLFEAAADSGNWAIGVDSDQHQTADVSVRDSILTSMLKNVDVAVYEYLAEVDAGNFPSGTVRYDLESDGVGYSKSGGFVDDISDRLDEFKQKIVDGEITVPAKP
jgi:basic membrane protein A